MTDKELDRIIAKLNMTIEGQHRERSPVYTVEDIREILELSRSAAYRLVNVAPFQVLRLSCGVRIVKKSFDAWYEEVK